MTEKLNKNYKIILIKLLKFIFNNRKWNTPNVIR